MITDEEAREIVAANVNRLMIHAGINQAKLAQLVGESEARVSQLRHGKKNAQFPFVMRVAEALGVNIHDLTSYREVRRGKKPSIHP